MKNCLLPAFLFLFLVSCQSLPLADKGYQCEQLDWFELGRSEGVQGKDSLGWKIKKQSCNDFAPVHHESFVNGWYTGVDEFCAPENAFAFGKSGQDYQSTCAAAKEDAFLMAYKKGLKVHSYEKENKSLSDELEKLNLLTSSSPPQVVPSLLKKMTELETQLELNKALISQLNSDVESLPSVQR